MENKEIKLKDFIYLDTNHITSMLAQIYKGNILNISDEVAKDKSATDEVTESEGSGKVALKASIKLFEIGMERNIDNDKTVTSNYISESQRQIINKTVDDYAYDLFYEHLETNNLLNSAKEDESYITIKGKFNLFDFDYLINALNSIKKIEKNSYLKAAKMTNDNLSEQTEIIKTVKEILSADSFIFIDNNVIVPKNDYFRYSELQRILRYDTKVNILGKIIKKVNSDDETDKGIKLFMTSINTFVPIIKDIIKLPKRKEF